MRSFTLSSSGPGPFCPVMLNAPWTAQNGSFSQGQAETVLGPSPDVHQYIRRVQTPTFASGMLFYSRDRQAGSLAGPRLGGSPLLAPSG